MKNNFLSNAINISNNIINQKVKEGMVVVDATVGNGKDTLKLAQKVGELGKVYGFDIQKLAIDNTTTLLKENGIYNRVDLIHDSHVNISNYITNKIDFAIFNLGYLPKGDHSIITKPESTIEAIKSILSFLHINGILIVVSYYGHKGGIKEKNEIENYFKILDQKKFTVVKMDFLNQINNPPIIFCIEKIS